MTKWISEIPALCKVEELAKKYAHLDPELATALEEVHMAREQAKERREGALKSKGIKCTECGELFLSTEWNVYTRQCSVGCRVKAFGDE
jgi:formylmethanofuran dehydrogenase subunit E